MRWSSVICIGTMIAAADVDAQPSEPTSITLSCDGQVTDLQHGTNPEPIRGWGIVVNLQARTVSGGFGIVARTDTVDDAGISFSGNGELGPRVRINVYGYIDRVTGAVEATTMTDNTINKYELHCKPTRRLF